MDLRGGWCLFGLTHLAHTAKTEDDAITMHEVIPDHFGAAFELGARSACFYDLNANTNTFTNERGEVDSSVISMPEGNTNPDGLATFFRKIATDSQLRDALEAYDWIAFKSCYSANAMPTDASLKAAKKAYEVGIKQFIISHPNIQFLIISPPPRRPLFTNKDAARRAQAFAAFLGEFATEHPNIMYFDLSSLLSDSEGFLKKEYRRWLPFDQHPNHVGSEKASHAFAGNFIEE